MHWEIMLITWNIIKQRGLPQTLTVMAQHTGTTVYSLNKLYITEFELIVSMQLYFHTTPGF